MISSNVILIAAAAFMIIGQVHGFPAGFSSNSGNSNDNEQLRPPCCKKAFGNSQSGGVGGDGSIPTNQQQFGPLSEPPLPKEPKMPSYGSGSEPQMPSFGSSSDSDGSSFPFGNKK
jgi:hypothetical protein